MQARLVQLQEELRDLEGGTVNLHPETVATMIDDQLVLNNIESLGITITDADVEEFILEIFAPIPLGDPTPAPTAEPTAAAWATETAEAFEVQITQTIEAQATEAAQATEEVDATPDADATPADPDADVTPTGDPAEPSTPDTDVDPTEEAEPLPTLPPTEAPTRDEAVAASQANYDQLEINFLEPAGMSRGDFERLIMRPALARQRAQEELAANVSPRAEQAHLAHILVATQEAAQELYDNRLQDEEFEDVAADVSIDAQTAPNGGDLGWNPPNAFVAGFGEAAFALEPGEISEPVQTEFGWHIIKMLDYDEDRPLTIQAFNQQQAAAFQTWLDDLRENADIETDVQLPSNDMPPLPPIG
jgi:peptidyl-prolyl cis-trans isomerase C